MPDSKDTISDIWRAPRILRRYGPQQIVNGYATKPSHEDITIKVDVQFVSGSDTSIETEGKRSTARIRTWGDFVILTADVKTGRPADRLWYQGSWWECEASVIRDKTILAHCRATFVRVSEADDEEAPDDTDDTDDGAAETEPADGEDKA